VEITLVCKLKIVNWEEEKKRGRGEREYPIVLALRPIALAFSRALALRPPCAMLAFSGVCEAALRKKISSSSSIMSSSVRGKKVYYY
jgi:hypothetical protein